MFNRRNFLKLMAGMTAGSMVSGTLAAKGLKPGATSDRLGELLPLRALGSTGEAVTMLGVGGWHLGRMSEAEAQKTVETALAGGVRFIDSAESYWGGGSEERIGKLLTPKYRDELFIMTKTTAGDAETARRHLEGSLRRMKTDHLDLWQIHAVDTVNDVDSRLSKGVLEVVMKAKEEGKARFIGFTGHTRPAAHLRMLEKTADTPDMFDTCQMPINACDPSYESFITNVLPKLMERKIGVLAMKTLANGGFFGGSQHGEHGDNPHLVPHQLTMREAIYFAWSLPISVLITGCDDASQLQEKIDLTKEFVPMDDNGRASLVARLGNHAGRRVEFYKG